MPDRRPEPANRSWAVRHMQILAGLVLDLAPTVDANRVFGEPMERIAAWREARARVLGERPGAAEYDAAGGLNPSALLRELADAMQAAAESHPEVARVLFISARSRHSYWSLTNLAVGDRRQWAGGPEPGPVVTEEVRAERRALRERWARGTNAAPPITPPTGRRASGRRP